MRTRKGCFEKIPLKNAIIVQIEKSYIKELKNSKESQKKRFEWLRHAQTAFNQYIRVLYMVKHIVSYRAYYGV